MGIVILGQDAHARSNTVWFEVLRAQKSTQLFLPVNKSQIEHAKAGLRQCAADLSDRIHLVPARSILGETSTVWHGIRDRIHDFQPDLIHVVAEPWALIAQLAPSWRPPFVIHSAENIIRSAPLHYRIRRLGTARVLQRASGAVSWGSTGLKALHDAGLPTSTPTTLCASRLPDPLEFPVSSMPPFDGHLRVAYCGRLVPEKGVQTLITAVSNIPANTVHLRIMGEGRHLRKLAVQAETCNQRIEFLGGGDAHAVWKLMSWCHVLVVPTEMTPRFREQWGRVAVEGMLTGRPVIVSDSGELPALVNDPSMVFRHGNSHELTELLNACQQDDGFLQDTARSTHDRARTWAPNVQANALTELWDQVLIAQARS